MHTLLLISKTAFNVFYIYINNEKNILYVMDIFKLLIKVGNKVGLIDIIQKKMRNTDKIFEINLIQTDIGEFEIITFL